MSGCEEVREILVAVGRGEAVSAPGQKFLREHVEECPECRRQLANQRMLSAGLSAMAAAQAGGPSEAVKAALLAEVRRRRVVVPMRGRQTARWVAAVGVAAALLIALIWAQRGSTGEKKAVAPAPRPVTTVTAQVEVPSVPVVTSRAKAPVARRRRVTPKPVVRAEEPAEVATDFFEIPYAEALRPEERADVFRIEMPRANMAVFGLPVMGGRLDTRVTADVLMGEDGVARAIRFIR